MTGYGSDQALGEFELIAELFRPLALGAPEALGLLDDAAVIPSRPGFELVLTADALVEGVHFLPDDPPGLVARKLLRVNLSDLAAKAAEPYGYLLTAAWPDERGLDWKRAFASGLGEDQARFGLVLLGGDTVSMPGPLTVAATMLGWAPAGAAVKRSSAKPGDVLMVTGTIGDGGLGLEAARRHLRNLSTGELDCLAGRYRTPEPRVELASALRAHAHAAADVSDGLLADAGHIARASGCGCEVELDRLPLSDAAAAWLERQPDRASALAWLASAGDDYEIVCAIPPEAEAAFAAAASGLRLTRVGRFTSERGVRAGWNGKTVNPGRMGWTHL